MQQFRSLIIVISSRDIFLIFQTQSHLIIMFKTLDKHFTDLINKTNPKLSYIFSIIIEIK